MRHLSVLLLVLATLFSSSSAFAQRIHPDNKKLDTGDFPDSFWVSASTWHAMQNQNRAAIDVLVAHFNGMPDAFIKLTDKQSVTEADIHTFVTNECPGEYDVEYSCLGALIFALIESEGRYGVSAGAPKNSKKAQADTLKRAQRVREAFRKKPWDYSEDCSYAEIAATAISVELSNGEYAEAMRLLHAEFPGAAAVGKLEGAAVPAALGKLPGDERDVFLAGISAVLASAGSVDWAGKKVSKKKGQRANVAHAIALYKASGVNDVAVEAGILESDPARRNEYYEFVHKAAIAGKFNSTLGWRHADLMYKELSAQATHAFGRINRFALPPSPAEDDQSCGD